MARNTEKKDLDVGIDLAPDGDAEFLTEQEFNAIIEGATKQAVESYKNRRFMRKVNDFVVDLITFLLTGTLGATLRVLAGWGFGWALKLLLGK